MTPIVRPATAEDFRAYAGFDVPQDYCIGGKAVGFAATRIVALGLVTWDLHGRAWGWFNEEERVAAVTKHRRALEMITVLRAVGEPVLHVFCGPAIPGAETWLRRLGFLLDAALTAALDPADNPKNLTVWTLNLSPKEA